MEVSQSLSFLVRVVDAPRNDILSNKKAPAKPGPSIAVDATEKISANRIRRSDAAPSAPGTARLTAQGYGRTSPSSCCDRLRGSPARRARRAEQPPARQ